MAPPVTTKSTVSPAAPYRSERTLVGSANSWYIQPENKIYFVPISASFALTPTSSYKSRLSLFAPSWDWGRGLVDINVLGPPETVGVVEATLSLKTSLLLNSATTTRWSYGLRKATGSTSIATPAYANQWNHLDLEFASTNLYGYESGATYTPTNLYIQLSKFSLIYQPISSYRIELGIPTGQPGFGIGYADLVEPGDDIETRLAWTVIPDGAEAPPEVGDPFAGAEVAGIDVDPDLEGPFVHLITDEGGNPIYFMRPGGRGNEIDGPELGTPYILQVEGASFITLDLRM